MYHESHGLSDKGSVEVGLKVATNSPSCAEEDVTIQTGIGSPVWGGCATGESYKSKGGTGL